MAQTDWSPLSDSASSSTIAVGAVPSSVVPMPNGGGSFVLAAHSLVNTAAVKGDYSALANFAPTSKGGDISAALYKGGAGGSLFSTFIFVSLNGQASTNSCYLLGLSDSEPAHLELRKGQLSGGLPDI